VQASLYNDAESFAYKAVSIDARLKVRRVEVRGDGKTLYVLSLPHPLLTPLARLN